MAKLTLFVLICTLFLAWTTNAMEIATEMGEGVDSIDQLASELKREGGSFLSVGEDALNLDALLTNRPKVQYTLADQLESELEILKKGLERGPGANEILEKLNPSLAQTPVDRNQHEISTLQVNAQVSTPTTTPTPFARMRSALQSNVNALDTGLKLMASTVSNVANTQARFADVVNSGKVDIEQWELAAQEIAKGPKILPEYKARTTKDVVDCTGCRFAWLKVEQDIGNTYSEKAIYDTFVSHCAQMQQSEIFFSPCNDMFAQIDDMVADYLNGHTVNQLCMNARMCR